MLTCMSMASADERLLTHKAFRAGTDRVVNPEQTLQTLTAFLPDFGITRVADVTGMDCIGIHTVMVVRPNSRSSMSPPPRES